MPDSKNTELVVAQEGPAVQVTMNRPEALNALSLEMIRVFSAGLTGWAADDGVKAVFVKGAGEKAFCAGGDIKSTYKTGMAYRKGEAGDRVLSLFYGEEYCLNRQMYHFKKPLIAFMNGITMGGGFGIAGPCRYRIVSERTVFAMPESGIGFFPDVGSMYYLNRAPGETGAFLSLGGGSIGPADMLYGGFATHYVPLDRQAALEEKLAAVLDTAGEADEAIEAVLADFHEPPADEGVLEKNRETIDSCFGGKDVRGMIDNLRQDDSLWARQQADIVESRSPVSLKVSLAHLRMTETMDFDEITAQDFILAQHFMKGHDFYEGVRAVLVDKDRQPQWDPRCLEDVTPEMVQDYFRPAGVALDEIAA